MAESSHRRAGNRTASADYFGIYHECSKNVTFTIPLMCGPKPTPACAPPSEATPRKLFPPRPINQLPAPNAACTRALLPPRTCRARRASPTGSVAATPPRRGTRRKGSTHSIACTGPASSQPGRGLGLHLHPRKRSRSPVAQMPIAQGIASHFCKHQDSHPQSPVCRAPCVPKLPKTKVL